MTDQKKHSPQRLAAVLLALVFVVMAVLPASAAMQTDYAGIYDDAGLFVDSELQQLSQQSGELSARYGTDIVVVTTGDKGDQDQYDFVQALYQNNGLGRGDTRSALFLLLDMQEYKVYLHSVGAVNNYLTNDDLDTLTRDIVETIDEDNYLAGSQLFFDRAKQLLAPMDTGNIGGNLFGGAQDTGYQKIYDYAELLDDEQEKELSQAAVEIADQYQIDIAVLTIDDNQGKSSMAFADDFYDYNGLGCGETGDGLILLMDMDARNIWISTKGKAIELFSDRNIDDILDVITPKMSDDDYYKAADKFLSMSAYCIEHEGKRVSSQFTPGFILLALGISLGVGGITIWVMYAGHKNIAGGGGTAGRRGAQSMQLYIKEDRFVSTHTSRTAIPKDSGGHSGGGSSTHTSSSGSSHGGGGRSF